MDDNARVCKHCEATVMHIGEEELDAAIQMLGQLPPEALAALQQAVAESDTAEAFLNRIFVGSCPKCGSENTGDCENDPEIDELLVGRCYDCGQLWCTECEKLLSLANHTCPCWKDDDASPES
jgi:hypothetical protein